MTPSDRQFRAPLVTRKPEIAGVQSALVIGQSGRRSTSTSSAESWCSSIGTARRSSLAASASRRFWAGSNRGALFVPRIGDEVLIDYEEGDPDRPIVVGSVYNGTNTVPMNLPGKKTNSGILTKSTKDSQGYNMLLFNDTAGSEIVKLRCQHDLMVKALNNETRVIGDDQSESIGGNVTKTVQGNETINIGSKGGQYSLTATQKITLTVGASSITMDPSSITLQSPTITVTGNALVSISAPMVKINS